MQFIYRGVAFQAPIAGIDALETEQTGNFLGKTYKMKQTQIANQRSHADLTYRGARYSR
ncbi:MAG: DUF4278 domain-containing protein [Cyanobacteria bacterium J06638_20]